MTEFEANPSNPILSADETIRRLEGESQTLRLIYHGFSRVTHTKPDAVFTVFPPLQDLEDGTKILNWMLDPFWREEQDFKGACAAIIEMEETATIFLQECSSKYLI